LGKLQIMAQIPNATLKTTEEFITTSTQLRQALRQTEIVTRRFQRRIESGASVTDSFQVLGDRGTFHSLTDLLDELEHARHACRRAIAAQAISEGMSRGELARMWGVSRQLVARIAKG
jgi:hypothetical protein